jgi:hypothetical protein
MAVSTGVKLLDCQSLQSAPVDLACLQLRAGADEFCSAME